MNGHRYLILVALGAGCGGSTGTGPVACTALAAPALSVSLTDSVTGATSGFRNVSLVAVSGTYQDSVFQATYPAAPFDGPVGVAYEHRGTFELTVLADGYLVWFRRGIVVTGDACHVTPVPVSVLLQHPIVASEFGQGVDRTAHIGRVRRRTN